VQESTVEVGLASVVVGVILLSNSNVLVLLIAELVGTSEFVDIVELEVL
jgi:ABC-type uncharacterized transport system permease subunit